MPQERIASREAVSRLLPPSGTSAVLADESEESFSILHFLLGGSLLQPLQLNELEPLKPGADLGSLPAF